MPVVMMIRCNVQVVGVFSFESRARAIAKELPVLPAILEVIKLSKQTTQDAWKPREHFNRNMLVLLVRTILNWLKDIHTFIVQRRKLFVIKL